MIKIDMNLLYTIINLIVLFLILRHFLIGPVTAVMEKRKKLIEDSMADADKSKAEAEALKKEYEHTLKGAADETARMLSEAKKQAQKTYEDTIGEADAQAQRILEQARQTARIEQEKAMAQVQTKAAQLALDAARVVLADTGTGDDPDGALYDRFLRRQTQMTEGGDTDEQHES